MRGDSLERYFGEATPKLGFGLMRLPKLENGEIDLEQVKEMVDLFLAAGQTYFDTAYVYDNGKSEEAARKALVERHDRSSFTLCTKLNAWMGPTDEQSAKQQFFTSLERTGAGYFDYYLLHALQPKTYHLYEDWHLWDFVKEQKAKGLIRHWGFSFHATPEILEELLTKHPDTEFVQLQLNYADWESEKVAARKCYEIARRHGKSIVVMEPVKGGALAKPQADVAALLKAAAPEMSAASWAIRYAASLDGILTVLSGMSDLEQMRDNLSFMAPFRPLDEAEQNVIRKAQALLGSAKTIPCTACSYCTPGCPKNIPIPDIFAARNRQLALGQLARGQADYNAATAESGKASDCITCGQCESACPQQLPVMSLLQDCAAQFDT